MEPPTTTLKFSVNKEITFKKSDLEAFKDVNDSQARSQMFYICEIFNVRYYIAICFKLGRNQRGKCLLALYVNNGSTKSVEADVNLSIACAKFSKNLKDVYDKPNGCGFPLSSTKDFFGSSSKFFIFDELILKVKGLFTINFSPRFKYTISAQWSIKESDLEPLRNSTNDGYLKSKRFSISTDSDTKYYLKIFPNGNKEKHRGKVQLYFHLHLENMSKIEAVLHYFIDSASFSCDYSYLFERNEGCGKNIFATKDLFDPDKRYIVDGQLILKVTGTLMIEKEREPTTLACENGVATRAYLRHRGKGFTIIIGDKSIKVHKKVLMDASPVFVGMFESGMKEAVEKKMSIIDFEFEIVDTAIKLLYSSAVPTKFTFEQILELLRFADKYQIEIIMDLVQDYLIAKISPTNVCYLINYTSSTVCATKLHTKCVEYLTKCFKETTTVSDLDILDKDFMINMFMEAFTKTFEIENV